MDTATDHEAFHARGNRTGGKAHGCEARGAVAIDRRAARLDEADLFGGKARHVTAAIERFAQHHVVHFSGIDAAALDRGLEHSGGHLLGHGIGERAFAGGSDSGPDGADDGDFWHITTPVNV